jgi:hypothetical protein
LNPWVYQRRALRHREWQVVFSFPYSYLWWIFLKEIQVDTQKAQGFAVNKKP